MRIRKLTALRSTEAMVSARCLRRSLTCPLDSQNGRAPARSVSGLRMAGTRPATLAALSRLIQRWASARTTSATTRMLSNCRGLVISRAACSCQ